MVAVFAANVLQEDEPVAGQVDAFVVDLLVGEVIHRQSDFAGEGLQDLEDAAVEADEGDPGSALASLGRVRRFRFRRQQACTGAQQRRGGRKMDRDGRTAAENKLLTQR